ncbi:unnamed protein product [Rangifer tarandus platyrhynchus]|uniref:Uncharacterized protein n=2 Tax=Rangifer tarandus platyrhynchus TaxID=3082113 RepID=A0ABN8ZQP0_RANTA|nr:unnamed protein product [Rangifer tarandus platyrhynchus]
MVSWDLETPNGAATVPGGALWDRSHQRALLEGGVRNRNNKGKHIFHQGGWTSASLRSPLASPSEPASSCSTPAPHHPRPPAKGKVRLRAAWHLSAPEPGPQGSGHTRHCPRGLPGSWLRLGLGDTIGGPSWEQRP